jgi:hypothetical protein
VIAPPHIAKSFTPSVIGVNGNSPLSLTITNRNGTTDLTGVAFTDTLPTGILQVALGANSCAGTESFTSSFAGPNMVSISPFTLLHASSFTASFTVLGNLAGSFTNAVTVTSANASTGNTATAGLVVGQPPSIAFTDTLPAGLVVATPSGALIGPGCAAATLLATAGSNTVSLSGGIVDASTSCVLKVNVTGITRGIWTNAVQATFDEGSSTTATATLVVAQPPAIQKAFGAPAIAPGTSTALSFTIDNPNPTVALTGIAFTDTLPAGLVVSSPNGLTGTCDGGTITATAGAGTISLTGATLPPSGTAHSP